MMCLLGSLGLFSFALSYVATRSVGEANVPTISFDGQGTSGLTSSHVQGLGSPFSFVARGPRMGATTHQYSPQKLARGRVGISNTLGIRGGQVSSSALMGQAVGWKDNMKVVGEEHQDLVKQLVEHGQAHVFERWHEPGEQDDKKIAMMEQLETLDKAYPGGIVEYLERSKSLLEEAQSGINTMSGFTPSVPTGERLEPGSDRYLTMESKGLGDAAYTSFVLVAGGLGERLGFGGIKVSLPSELVTGKSYLQLYIESILALQKRSRENTGDSSVKLELAIMTSGDTHDQTLELLEKNNYFGMDEDQVTLVQQQKVPALSDSSPSLAVDPNDPYKLLTKPHGHGDVHTLLHQHGVAKKWAKAGKKWLVFFQDTNGLIFQAVPALIGVSKHLELEVNTLTVPRRPGESVGSICHLKNEKTGQELTVNVEYNQLEPLLKGTVSPEGDVPDESGFSPYPGNTNALVFRAEPYARILEETGGLMPEFVNPKYKDHTKTTFKKPTRLECMMQDYPRLLSRGSRVGFTQIDRWCCFAACKNNAEDAGAQFHKTGFGESASTAEAAIYRMYAEKLRRIGANVAEAKLQEFNGVPTAVGPKVVLSPSFAMTMEEMKRKFKSPDKVSVTEKSTLYLDGRDIEVKALELDGALVVKAVPGAHVVIDGLKVSNEGWPLEPIDVSDLSIPESLRIRGYKIVKAADGTSEYTFSEPGEYTLP